MEKITALREKLDRLRQAGPTSEVFGAWKHQYELSPTLSEKEVSDFETKCSITFPQDYRDFLLYMGNGGAGPGFGLIPPGQFWGFDISEDEIPSHLRAFLAKPFPFVTAWEMDDSEIYITDTKSLTEYEKETEIDECMQGSIPLADYGCGMVASLVITGEERGNIWIDNRCNDGGIYPFELTNNQLRMDFYSWYNTWLDDSLEEKSES